MDISDFALAKLRADNLRMQQQVSLLAVQVERLRITLDRELGIIARV